jgi:hypothetical protein
MQCFKSLYILYVSFVNSNTRSTLEESSQDLLFRDSPFENHCSRPSSRNVLEQIIIIFYITISE